MSSAVGASVLVHVAQQVKQRGDGQFSDSDGQLLASLPPEELRVLQLASELVTRRCVTKVSATPSKRNFFRVSSLNRYRSSNGDREVDRSVDGMSQPFDNSLISGGGPNYYNCFRHYCTCAAFHETTVTTHPTAMCKHMVARLLADATGQFETMEVEDIHFAQMLCPPRSTGDE
ncbi:minichromosome maintenance- protein [Phytophthora boehmeriae]|uniref:Minichromosome maintenance- protein n=1 Tax=Phytophthora boehmeriae TaxID=109152 RepID=A0A8T1VX53_9STRA|nr:minichromosome maintenance- protein [Phytophthora boehmeriae]